MDLITLWNREKTRLTTSIQSNKLASTPVDRKSSLSEQNPRRHSSQTGPISCPLNSTTKLSSPSNNDASLNSSTTSCNNLPDENERLQLFLTTNLGLLSLDSIPHIQGNNGFAMEFTERALRRYVPPCNSSPALNSPLVPGSNLNTIAPTSRIRKQSTSPSPSKPRHSPSVQLAHPIVQPNPNLPTLTQSAQVLRKKGRKRVDKDHSSHVLKPYSGDLFGTRGNYIDGMVYISRMKQSYQVLLNSSGNSRTTKLKPRAAIPPWSDVSQTQGRNVLKDGVSDAFAVARGTSEGKGSTLRHASSFIFIQNPSDDDDEEQGGSMMSSIQRKQQQRCSLILSNWSFNPTNARLMVQEHVVEALIRLCKDGDKTTRLNCITTLMNLSHVCELGRVIVQQGAVKTLAEIVNDMEDKTIRTACAITLCNLCALQGQEEVLVEDGAVSALTTLITEHPKVSHICRCALFNLTCVSQSYHKIESVLKAFIALISARNGSARTTFARRTEEEYDDITAKALCNLSNLTRIRLRLMEEGIVSAIAPLLHPHLPLIQELVAQMLLNLSRLSTCRNEMVAKGCMGILIALARATSTSTTKYLIGMTLWNLSKEHGNAVRMVLEGLVMLVTHLCQDIVIPTSNDIDEIAIPQEEDIVQICAHTLYNVSCCQDSRSKLVERHAVKLLSSFSRRAHQDDAKRLCTVALCNLLTVHKAAADIVSTGAITVLIQLSMTCQQSYQAQNLFSKALQGLCDQQSTRLAVIDAGVIPALLFLSNTEPETNSAHESLAIQSAIRARCTASFASLAADCQTASHVCNAAVVQCVMRILALERANVAIERSCCSCLSFLCRDEQCSHIMVHVGALDLVLATCINSIDQESQACCCHVVASISCHSSCCAALVSRGVIAVVATLSKIKENATIQRCCALTLANLSMEPLIRQTLASAGLVTILALLSNSYSEDTQRDCAKVLCNLSCLEGYELQLVKEGALEVLMMISLVRAVKISTKETCLRALVNLLTLETMDHMINEGLVNILPVYAALASKQAARLVTLIFGKLLHCPRGRSALCAERSSFVALFQLMPIASETEESQVTALHENVLDELVQYDNCRLLSVQTGLFEALERLSTHKEHGNPRHCSKKIIALVLLTLAKSKESRLAVASSSTLATIATFLPCHTPTNNCLTSECAVYAVATLCWLSWHHDTREFVAIAAIPCALTRMLQQWKEDGSESYSAQTLKMSVLTLCCLAYDKALLEVMLKEDIVTHLNELLTFHDSLANDQEVVALVSILFRQLSHVTSFTAALSTPSAPVLALFCTLVQRTLAKHDMNSSLDCADALCSLAFASHSPEQAPDSQPPRPSQFLVDRRVLHAIGSLLSADQLLETRWRCAASLWALSAVPEYRKDLIELGVTRMLVNESSRAVTNASLHTLQCCAGALCNLTLGSKDANSLQMIHEGAMPALIHLAKLENATIRQHCTLALSNLSGPSPTVESGAVAALLNLSLDSMSRRSSQWQPAVLCRPCPLSTERHEQVALLPELSIEMRQSHAWQELKLEAELAVSSPPSPHVLTLVTDLADTTNVVQSDEKAHEFMETRCFDKLAPEESVALMAKKGDDEDDEMEELSLTKDVALKERHEDSETIDFRRLSSHQRSTSIVRNYPPVSPLSWADDGKGHNTSTRTTRKERERQRRDLAGSQSLPSLVTSSLDTDNCRTLKSSGEFNEPKRTQPATDFASSAQLESFASSSVSFAPCNESIDTQAALLAATSAAGLYHGAPPRHYDDPKTDSSRLYTLKQKKRAAMKRKARERQVSDTAKGLTAQPKTDHVVAKVTTMDEFQDQAKFFGLWNS